MTARAYFRCPKCGTDVFPRRVPRSMRHACGTKLEPIPEAWEAAAREDARRFYLGLLFAAVLVGLVVAAMLVNNAIP